MPFVTLLQVSYILRERRFLGFQKNWVQLGFNVITDIHSSTLGLGKSDDSLARIPEINGELAMVRRLSLLCTGTIQLC